MLTVRNELRLESDHDISLRASAVRVRIRRGEARAARRHGCGRAGRARQTPRWPADSLRLELAEEFRVAEDEVFLHTRIILCVHNAHI